MVVNVICRCFTRSLYTELHTLLRVMWCGKYAIVSPHRMLDAVWQLIPFFKGYSQQDAQEFLWWVKKPDNCGILLNMHHVISKSNINRRQLKIHIYT